MIAKKPDDLKEITRLKYENEVKKNPLETITVFDGI